MTPEVQKLLNEHFLGKRISVPVPDTDNYGNKTPNNIAQCTGICTYIGPNNTLNWDLQVTVDLMPVQVKHINDITII